MVSAPRRCLRCVHSSIQVGSLPHSPPLDPAGSSLVSPSPAAGRKGDKHKPRLGCDLSLAQKNYPGFRHLGLDRWILGICKLQLLFPCSSPSPESCSLSLSLEIPSSDYDSVTESLLAPHVKEPACRASIPVTPPTRPQAYRHWCIDLDPLEAQPRHQSRELGHQVGKGSLSLGLLGQMLGMQMSCPLITVRPRH